MKTYQKVYNLVKKIPKGKVMTYGQIGQILDLNPRVVGWALNRLAKYRTTSLREGSKSRQSNLKNVKCHSEQSEESPNVMRSFVANAPQDDMKIPWQRVINSKGSISTNKLMNIPLDLQKRLLEKEGIKFDKNQKIDLKKHLWKEFRLT